MSDKSVFFIKLNKKFDLLVNVFGILTIAIYFALMSTKVLALFIVAITFTVLVFAVFFISSIEENESILKALHPKNYDSNFIKGLLWFWIVFIFFSITKITQNPLLCGKCLLIAVIFSILLFIIDFFIYCNIDKKYKGV